MRTIKFRGRRIDNNEWVYGYLYRLQLPNGEACMILTQDNNHLDNSLEPKYHLAFTLWVDLFIVDPATVGQFTGLLDKNGKEIYEGDILRCGESIFKVSYEGSHLGSFSLVRGGYFAGCFGDLTEPFYCEVIGNIHDNPELLEGASMKASECKCCSCGKQAVAFWPIYDPDIPSYPYCRACLDKAKMELAYKLWGDNPVMMAIAKHVINEQRNRHESESNQDR